MMLKVFSVFDSKAEAYLAPFFVATQAQAVRSVAKAALTEDHDFSKFGGDFTLFELGEWSDEDAQFLPHPAAINLGTALAIGLRAASPQPALSEAKSQAG